MAISKVPVVPGTKTLARGSVVIGNASGEPSALAIGSNTYENDTTWEATKVLPKYQGIDQSKLVPLLVKTIQELEARITTLENA